MTKQESIEAYKHYIEDHINNVNKAYELYGEELCKKLGVDLKRLKDNINVHDKSKYSEEEFEPYRLNFFKDDECMENDETIEDNFQKAWEHHYSNNPHHPQFWITKNDNGETIINDMGKIYIAEMLLDWAAMSMVKGGSAYSYYYPGGRLKPFSENTRTIIESVIDLFK